MRPHPASLVPPCAPAIVAPPATARGFSLVEVLVALVVLAVGLLGSAALLVESLAGSRAALERSRAVALAGDLAERIRANPAAGAAYDTVVGTPQPAADPSCEQTAAGCDAATMASHDLSRWRDAIVAQLPAGSGEVHAVALAGGAHRYEITVRWAQGTAGAGTSFTLASEP